MDSHPSFPLPTGGASLLLSFRLLNRVTLILGSGALAATRAFSSLEADSTVIVLSKGGLQTACEELRWRAQRSQLVVLDWDEIPGSSTIQSLVLDDEAADIPELCDFTFTSTHRFEDAETGQRTALQIGVTTNGQGCRLAGRVRREIVSRLPREVGAAAEKIGRMRAMVKVAARPVKEPVEPVDESLDDVAGDTSEDSDTTPNRPVPLRGETETERESISRKAKWVAQVSEYWPISKLASLSDEEMLEVLAGEPLTPPNASPIGPGTSLSAYHRNHTALTELADLVLADKLVPDVVLALIPKGVQIRIARKFPGNAEGAQNEMMEAAVEAANGDYSSSGDPIVYGRAGEEVLYFRSHGFEPLVIPGVSSALAAPTFAGIPVTQRGVAESFTVCTGVGRKGRDVQLPGYERGRTLVILMGVARLAQVVSALTGEDASSRRDGARYPAHTPIAIIERASMPDQRVLTSTLRDVVVALESSGEQRPPGMIVVGWAVLALWGKGEVDVLDDAGELGDEDRIARWLGDAGAGWRVKTGLESTVWDELLPHHAPSSKIQPTPPPIIDPISSYDTHSCRRRQF
ncbi:tetrapyrrole methylase [Infundibulicybe gibba]|nr:tetrapyrrole methylase [Infundibulicybe gibba]